MDLINKNKNKNQKQILPYSGTTISSIKNSQVSGFYDHNLNTFILKYNENNLNNKNITSVSSSTASLYDKVEGSIGLLPAPKPTGPTIPQVEQVGERKNIKAFGGSQTSFEHLTLYNKNLSSQFNKFNNKNQIILNLKKVTMCTTDTESEQQQNKISTKAPKSTLISKGTEYLGGINILTPVKVNNNTISISDKGYGGISPHPATEWKSGGEGSLSNTNIGAFEIKGNRTNKFNVNMDTIVSKYLKTFSKFNINIATSQYLVYSFNNKQKIISNITSILKNSFYFMNSIISRPVLDITPNKIIINLFFFVSRNKNRRKVGNSYNNLKFLSANHNQLQFLCINLSKYLKKPVELELIRLYYPYNDSQILANTIGLLSKNIRNRFRTLVDNTFNFSKIKNPTKMIMLKKPRISILPSFLTGIKIRLGGRLLSQKVVPRFTVQTFQEGSLARTKANIVTSSRFTHKNKRGTFSITISVGQGFF